MYHHLQEVHDSTTNTRPAAPCQAPWGRRPQDKIHRAARYKGVPTHFHFFQQHRGQGCGWSPAGEDRPLGAGTLCDSSPGRFSSP
jgi:hypothetical protein